MKAAVTMAGIILAALPSASSANPQEDAVRAVIRAITHGEDLNAAFPGTISAKDIAALPHLSKCTAHNLIEQRKGDYTVVWACGSKIALGMEILVTDNKVTSISTMEVFRRPTFQPH
ncbi:MAG TPA: hypothetical protein VGF77_16830 [Allosphingosinicella sp.]|jgi:hypothetical protein